MNHIIKIFFAASIALLTACTSDNNSTLVVETTPDDPDVIEVTAPIDLSGVWEGSITQDTTSYDVKMVFSLPAGSSEGRVMGIAKKQGSDEPYILIDAGYQNVTNENLGYEYLVGKDGSHGTFMKFFEFDKNLVGAKRGSITLNLTGNTLTGTTTLEDQGDFTSVFNYSLQNAIDSTLTSIVATWSDANYGWDDLATGTTLTVNPDGTISALATGASTCEAAGMVSDIDSYNIYAYDGTSINTGVSLTGCSTRITNAGTPQVTFEDVDGDYDGMGFVIEDVSGNTTLVVMMSSTLLKTPSMATYNEFIRN